MDGAVIIPAYGAAITLSAVALVRDRADAERRRTSLAAFVWAAAATFRVGGGDEALAPLLLAVDLGLVFFLIALAWRARHGWPVIAAIVQAVGAAALMAKLIDSRISGDLHLMVSATATHLTAAILLAGAWIQRSPRPAVSLSMAAASSTIPATSAGNRSEVSP